MERLADDSHGQMIRGGIDRLKQTLCAEYAEGSTNTRNPDP
jgi:hypothetical protein